ncbi:MAG: hypothetical protein ACREXW_02290 [Gammaproteobacteria bacterium]
MRYARSAGLHAAADYFERRQGRLVEQLTLAIRDAIAASRPFTGAIQ